MTKKKGWIKKKKKKSISLNVISNFENKIYALKQNSAKII